MQSRKGSMIIVAGLVIAVIIIVGVIVYKFMTGNNNYSMKNYSQNPQVTAVPELTKTDEISDIEKDLNSTNTDNLDADVLGITSQVE